MSDVLDWLHERLAEELTEAGHTPDDPVWVTAVEMLPTWTGSMDSLHACLHVALPEAQPCLRFPRRLVGEFRAPQRRNERRAVRPYAAGAERASAPPPAGPSADPVAPLMSPPVAPVAAPTVGEVTGRFGAGPHGSDGVGRGRRSA